MRIERATLETCGAAAGAVVVIDVLRSFTTAAFAFAAGAREILPVGTAEDALALRERFPAAVVAGAAPGGWPIAGFDLGNSPAALADRQLGGRQIILCTAGGAKGLVRSRGAESLLAASLVCAGATARHLLRLAPPLVTLVVTGIYHDRDGDEDIACADYIAALLRGDAPEPAEYARRARESDFGRRFTDPHHPATPAADLACCASVDRFDFAMPVDRRGDLLVMTALAV
ncbi:MAG: 2-phosphosulfolactate phosphatase [Kouleothrix sp.]|nr:2-phosphosulfolactate phosphatase [Kouleothrix sp.]